MLCYDAGLRLGEALGLEWGDVWWGADENDTTRRLSIERSRSGNRVGLTKSGRSRKVMLSRRLRSRLMARHMERGRPSAGTFVVEQSWGQNIRARLERVRKAAKIRPLKLKDLRDTYASTLITHGIVLRWISGQLGHGSLAVTERHYAKYMAADSYTNPWQVPRGCHPSDLFAYLERSATVRLESRDG